MSYIYIYKIICVHIRLLCLSSIYKVRTGEEAESAVIAGGGEGQQEPQFECRRGGGGGAAHQVGSLLRRQQQPPPLGAPPVANHHGSWYYDTWSYHAQCCRSFLEPLARGCVRLAARAGS